MVGDGAVFIYIFIEIKESNLIKFGKPKIWLVPQTYVRKLI